MLPKYEEDFHSWAMNTADLLRQRRFDDVDMDHLIEEIESMGRSEKQQLTNRLAVLIAHLLKWQYQSEFRTRSWQGTIDEQRFKIKEIIEDNPSLKAIKEESIKKAYKLSFSILKRETTLDLKVLPEDCPYDFEQCSDDDFLPL